MGVQGRALKLYPGQSGRAALHGGMRKRTKFVSQTVGSTAVRA